MTALMNRVLKRILSQHLKTCRICMPIQNGFPFLGGRFFCTVSSRREEAMPLWIEPLSPGLCSFSHPLWRLGQWPLVTCSHWCFLFSLETCRFRGMTEESMFLCRSKVYANASSMKVTYPVLQWVLKCCRIWAAYLILVGFSLSA